MSVRWVTILASMTWLNQATLAQENGKAHRFTPDHLPFRWETDQSGYNNCNLNSNSINQTSHCQTAWINSAEDFCIWGPPKANSIVGNEERVMVAWCTKGTHGTRVIPDGTLKGVHFVKTNDYVQVTGIGDLTKINIAQGDDGGELDPHGADGKGNPIGGLVFTTAFGNAKGEQVQEWTNFISSDMFCIKACLKGKTKQQCQHIYDVMGCYWNMPGNYYPGFETCDGDVAQLPGVYGTSTWYQGVEPTPVAHPAPASSNCKALPSISNQLGLAAVNLASVPVTSISASASPTSLKTDRSSAAPSTTSSVTSTSLSAKQGSPTVEVSATASPASAAELDIETKKSSATTLSVALLALVFGATIFTI